MTVTDTTRSIELSVDVPGTPEEVWAAVATGPGIGDTGAGMTFEWLVDARDNETCVVRLVNDGFGSGEEVDAQLDGMTADWRMFLHNLALHRRFFPARWELRSSR